MAETNGSQEEEPASAMNIELSPVPALARIANPDRKVSIRLTQRQVASSACAQPPTLAVEENDDVLASS